MSYMDFSYLVATEIKTQREFDERLKWHQTCFVQCVDALFAIGNFVQEPATDVDDWFPFILWQRLALVPYSFRAANVLAQRGYNAEGYMVLRHVLEAFVQLRYFSVHRKSLRPHLEAKTAKNRVKFKTMFEEFSPGYYDKYYSLASGVAHAGLHHSVVGMTIDRVTERLDPPLGCEFSEKKASLVVNQSFMLMLGFLTQTPTWSPTYHANVSAADPNVETRRLAAIEELEKWRKGHRAMFADSHEWMDKSALLIGTT